MNTCPACHKGFDPDKSGDYLPFCSERCRMIDLGAWLTEKHTIPGNDIEIDVSGNDGDEPTRH